MKISTKLLVIAKDDFPLEVVYRKGHPILNFINYWLRRLIHGDHKECHECYERRKGIKVSR